jgi:GGDEF domain-containing protein
MRSTRSIEILCLALAALVLIWSGALTNQMWPVLGLLAAFALAIVAFRGRRFLPGRTRTKLLIESWSMVVFITGVLWFTGKGASPLFNLVLAAHHIERVDSRPRGNVAAGGGRCGLPPACLAMTTPGVEVISLLYASQVVGQLAPFLLVAYLTTTLSADITEARERIENLAQTDSLTGLYNVRMFNEVWQREHDCLRTRPWCVCLLMIDMDKLKDINDVFGHEAGNSAITLVAQCLQRSIRATDHAARLRRRRIRGPAARRVARGCGGRDQTRAAQRLQDHARS